jgi:hypothetical protein
MDDDKDPNPASRLAELNRQLGQQAKPAQFTLPASLASIQSGTPRTGVYVLPDNASPGTLEDLLLDCAGINYLFPAIAASNYVQKVDRSRLSTEEQKNLKQGSNEKKAHVGAIVSLLRPGKTTQVSIHDNRWLKGDALESPRIIAFRVFLSDLLNEPVIYPSPSAPSAVPPLP